MLDVMSSKQEALGFSNRWYEGAIQTATAVSLPSGKQIRVITAPFFLGTKMEAFSSRGQKDYFASHDLEDFIAVVDGRERLLEEIYAAPADLQTYLAEAVSSLLRKERFLDALPGYVLGDFISQGRIPIIVERLRKIGRL